MSWSSLGRGTAQSGTAGIVILDLRIDMSASIDVRARPINPVVVRAAIGTPLFQHVKHPTPRTREVPGAARGHAELRSVVSTSPMTGVSRHHPGRISPG